MKLALGSLQTDSITGFTGVVVTYCKYLNGCKQYELQPKELHEGKPVASVWFDEQRLTTEVDEKQPGGPGNHPPALSRPEGR